MESHTSCIRGDSSTMAISLEPIPPCAEFTISRSDFDSFESAVSTAPPSQSFLEVVTTDRSSVASRSLIAVESCLFLYSLKRTFRATPKSQSRPRVRRHHVNASPGHDERLRKSVGGLVGVDAATNEVLRMSSRFVTKSVRIFPLGVSRICHFKVRTRAVENGRLTMPV